MIFLRITIIRCTNSHPLPQVRVPAGVRHAPLPVLHDHALPRELLLGPAQEVRSLWAVGLVDLSQLVGSVSRQDSARGCYWLQVRRYWVVGTGFKCDDVGIFNVIECP